MEQPPTSDTMYRHRSLYPKGINPMEIQGLQAVLCVIRRIAGMFHRFTFSKIVNVIVFPSVLCFKKNWS